MRIRLIAKQLIITWTLYNYVPTCVMSWVKKHFYFQDVKLQFSLPYSVQNFGKCSPEGQKHSTGRKRSLGFKFRYCGYGKFAKFVRNYCYYLILMNRSIIAYND